MWKRSQGVEPGATQQLADGESGTGPWHHGISSPAPVPLNQSCLYDLWRLELWLLLQIERDKLMKEKQTREEIMKQRDELEKKLLEFQEEASRVKEALVRKR